MVKKNDKQIIKSALIKKAVGYNFKEVTKEFDIDDEGNQVLCKQKISVKHLPPDLASIKILLAFYTNKTDAELEQMSEQDLKAERDKLLELLKNEPENNREDL